MLRAREWKSLALGERSRQAHTNKSGVSKSMGGAIDGVPDTGKTGNDDAAAYG